MVDQVLRIGIDSSQAEAGARKVSASLKQIQRDAANAMGNGKGIPVELDTSGIAGAGDEVNRAIQDILRRAGDGKIPLGFDVDDLSDEANRIVREIREEFDRNLRDGIPIETSLKVLTESVESEIDRVLADASRDVSISVSADTADAQREIDRLRDNLRGPGLDGATVRIDADASDVVREAGRAEDAIRQVGDAADDLSRMGGIGIDVSDVAADSAKVAAGLDKVSDNAKKAAVSAKDMGDAFSSALQGEEALELLGEALLAIATSIGTAIVAFEDYQDAVRAATGDSEAATVAMEMIEQFATDTAFSIEDVTAAFVKLRSAGLEASKEALTSYGNVAAGLNLTMEELATAVGQAAQGSFSALNDTQLKAVESGNKVKFTYQGVTTEVANTGKAVAEFIKKMGNTEFAGLMEEQAEGVTGALEAMSEAWQELSRDMGEGGLSQGLIEFSHSMKAASEAADELGRLLGGWLGAEMTALGNFVETTVKEINALIDAFQWLGDAISSIPSISDALGSVRNYLSQNVAPNLLVNTPEAGEEQGPPTDPNRTNAKAFGTDTNLPRKPKRTAKTKEQRQAENFAEDTANNKEMIRTLTLMDEAYDRGRISVEGFRNSVEELNIRQAAQKRVGKENAEAIVEQAMAIKYLEESMAFKAEVLDQQEAIIQTVELAEAYKSGADAVEQAEAKQKAYNTAVKLGGVNMPGFIDQLTELEAAAKEANDNLKLEESLFDLDQEIESVAKMATAYREGGGAVREAALEQQVYAAALAAGEADEEDSIARIREKMTALRDLQEIQQSDERAMMAGFDLEQMEGELRISQMVGEARYIEAERLEMLTNKKRETKDATAELTAEEERLAEAMGRANAAMAGQSSALEDLANSIPNIAYAFEEATAGALMHFEDALVSIVTGTKSAREAFADMAKSIAADLARMAVRMAIIQPLAMMFGGMGGMAGGMVATGAPMALGGVYHTGGIVGADPVPTRSFAALPKFHTGGIVGADDANPHPFATFPKFHTGGLASNETPAVLQKGEGVFTAQQMAALQPVNNNDMSAPVTINVSVQQTQGGDPAAAENQGRIIAKQVQMAMGDYLQKQQKNGGMLNPNGGY